MLKEYPQTIVKNRNGFGKLTEISENCHLPLQPTLLNPKIGYDFESSDCPISRL